MKVIVVAPAAEGPLPTGNWATARQWAGMLAGLGHEVTVADAFAQKDGDVLVALHAAKSHDSVLAFQRRYPERSIIVGTAGTDIYPEPGADALDSLQRADRIVVLQAKAMDRLPVALHPKVRVIVQSVEPALFPRRVESKNFVDICVVGHLRDVKDPLRAAKAARLLPTSSRIRIRHAGALLDPKYAALVEAEQRENPRYAWLGPLGPAAVREVIGRSRVMVLSSRSEGGARVVGEALVAGTPILGTRIDGITGLVGDDYPGLFPVGDSETLAALLTRVETDRGFLDSLREHAARLAPLFEPARERKAWEDLLASILTA